MQVPLGVVLCIPPFNYPVNLAVSKIAPALMAGNTVVIKPPTQARRLNFLRSKEASSNPPLNTVCYAVRVKVLGCGLVEFDGASS